MGCTAGKVCHTPPTVPAGHPQMEVGLRGLWILSGKRNTSSIASRNPDRGGCHEAGRPGLEAALDLVRRQAAEILYVAKLHRFSRRGLHHVGALLDEVDGAGGRVIFVADGLDTRHPAARKTVATLAEQARAEADAATWRLSQWHAHNRRNGRWKRIRPYGYLVRDGKLDPHPLEAPIVRGMIDSFLAGASLRGIAMHLNAQGIRPPRLVFYEEAIAKGYRAKRPVDRRVHVVWTGENPPTPRGA